MIILAACGGSQNRDQTADFTKATAKDDIFWQDCAWLSEDEFSELERLRTSIEQSPVTSKNDFDRYVKILNLEAKTDADLVKCNKATPEGRKKLMEHFVFLGLSYGQGEFSFVDKPRLASLFEMDYFYFYEKRKFLGQSFHNQDYFSNPNLSLAKYLFGWCCCHACSSSFREECSFN